MPTGLKVFIVGSPRSGTSITFYAMKEVMGLPGYGESHVFPIFQRIIHEFYQYSQEFAGQTEVAASHLDTDTFKAATFNFIRGVYQRVYGEENWVDKTPGGEAIRGVPVILEAFPSAKVIIPRRTGIEAVNSILKKFSVKFSDACTIWAVAARDTLTIRDGGFRVLELDQFDLTNKPEQIGQKLALFLERPEKARELARFFASQRFDQLSRHDWTRRVTLAESGWSDADRRTFQQICGPMMSAFGYPL